MTKPKRPKRKWKRVPLDKSRTWALPSGTYRAAVQLSPLARLLATPETIAEELASHGLDADEVLETKSGGVVIVTLREPRTLRIPEEVVRLERLVD